MKRPTKFVTPLTEQQREQLHVIMKSAAPQRKRMRAHAVLLRERAYSIEQIADIYQVDRDRVSQWLDWWEEEQFEGLEDDPRSGRPPKLTEPEQKQAVKLVRQEPRSLKQGLKQIADKLGQPISGDTLKRLLKAANLTWKRLRRSLRSYRDEGEFRAAEAALEKLRVDSLAADREVDLWYYDEAGFTLTPCIP